MADTDPSTEADNADNGAEQANQSQSEPSSETTPATETAPVTTEQTATPEQSAQPAPGSLPSQTRSAPQPSTASQTNGKTNTAPPTQQTLDYEKQYRSILPVYTKATQQLKAWEKFGDPEQVSQQLAAAQQLQQQQRQQAEAQKLQPWDPRHPDASKTMQRLDRVRNYSAAVNALPQSLSPEQRNEAAQAIARSIGVSAEDGQLYREQQEHEKNFLTSFARDPRTTIREEARQEIQAAFQEFEQFHQLRAQTQQFLNQNQDLVKTHAADIEWAMNNPARREVGIEVARLRAKVAALEAQQDGAMEAKASADAQKALTKRRNTVPRDGGTAPVETDPVAAAEKEGLTDEALANRLIQSRRTRAAMP
jgi:hypothetical protein